MIWWYWMVLGLVLLGAEMTTPGGFYIIFFGLSALLVGTLAGLEIVNMDWVQWLLFSVIAIGSLLLFRGPLLARMSDGRKTHAEVDSLVGEVAIPLEALPAGATWDDLRRGFGRAGSFEPRPLPAGRGSGRGSGARPIRRNCLPRADLPRGRKWRC